LRHNVESVTCFTPTVKIPTKFDQEQRWSGVPGLRPSQPRSGRLVRSVEIRWLLLVRGVRG